MKKEQKKRLVNPPFALRDDVTVLIREEMKETGKLPDATLEKEGQQLDTTKREKPKKHVNGLLPLLRVGGKEGKKRGVQAKIKEKEGKQKEFKKGLKRERSRGNLDIKAGKKRREGRKTKGQSEKN